MNATFWRFLLVGGISAAANWASRFLFALAMPLAVSVVPAYLVGMTTAYVLSRLFVFERTGRSVQSEYLRFALVNVVALAQVEAVTLGLADFVFPWLKFAWHPDAVAHGVGVMSPAVTSYLAHKHFTFAQHGAEAAADVETAPVKAGPWDGVGENPQLPLIVDLDGTLLRTDTLAESVVAGLTARPLLTLAAFASLLQGRSAFKHRLAELVQLNCNKLPINEPLLQFLRQENSNGRALYLATAANERLALQIAGQYPIFESVHGSAPTVNLKGSRKADLLESLFPAGFAYAGDSAADLAVWRRAKGIILVGVAGGVARRARRLGVPVEAEFPRARRVFNTWRRALRLHQWSKNILIFVPLALSSELGSPANFLRCLAGFILAGVAASATYLVNDLADLSSDREHRTKRRRPLASGELPVAHGLVAVPLMLGAAFAGAVALSTPFAFTLLAYVSVTLSYSLRLKRVPLLDVLILAALYTIRLVAGTVLAGAVFSPWLLTFSGFFFFSMSLAKRHVEVASSELPPNVNLPGRGYRPADAALTLSLGVGSSVAAVLVIVQYMMAEAFPSNVYHLPAALWSAPILLAAWISRIWLLAHRGELDDDPVAFAVKDKVSIGLGAILGLTFAIARFG